MVTITLTPELEVVVAAKAKEAGTTPEQFALAALEKQLRARPENTEHPVDGKEAHKTLADLLGDSIGSINSGGANLSKDTGRKFAEGMVKKRKEGKF